MTVARKHPILGNLTKNMFISKTMIDFDPKEHEIYLVFMVENMLPNAEA